MLYPGSEVPTMVFGNESAYRDSLLTFLWGNSVDRDMCRRLVLPLVKAHPSKDIDGILASLRRCCRMRPR